MANDFKEQVHGFARSDFGFELHRLIVVQLGFKKAAENHVARKRATNLHVDVPAAVVADSLRVNLMVIPTDERRILFDLHAVLANLAKLALPMNLQPQVVATDLEFLELEEVLRIGTEVYFDFVADVDVLDGLLREIGKAVAAVVAKDSENAVW